MSSLMFLYDLSDFMMGTVIVGAYLVVTLSAYGLFHRIFPREFTDEEQDRALGFSNVVATVTGLLLAFSAVSVWDSFSSASDAVSQEATIAGELQRDLGTYNSPESLKVRESLRDYVKVVVKDEWPAMARGEASPEAWEKFDHLFHLAARIYPASPRDEILLGEIWGRLNEMAGLRRSRIETSQSEVPLSLWTVVLIGTAISFALTFPLPINRFNVTMIGSFAVAMGLVFYFIIAMDHPFAGSQSVSPEPFQSFEANAARWDVEVERESANDAAPAADTKAL